MPDNHIAAALRAAAWTKRYARDTDAGERRDDAAAIAAYHRERAKQCRISGKPESAMFHDVEAAAVEQEARNDR